MTDTVHTAPGVALVTGAAGIIGPGIVRTLGREGWKVAAAEHDERCFDRYRRLYREEPPGDCLLTGDLRDRETCWRLVRETEAALGPVRLLVNAATGHTRAVSLPFDRFDETTSRPVFEVDLLAPLFLAQAALEGLSRQGGLVVNLSSVRVAEFTRGSLLYSSIKAAVETFTQALAVELAPHGVRVNAIRIGSIPGLEFLRGALDLLPDAEARELREEVHASLVEDAPEPSLTGRAGLSSDAGQLIAYLASEAGRFINGAVLPLDGGYLSAKQRLVALPPEPLEEIRRWWKQPHESVEAWRKARASRTGENLPEP
ncbi:MAG TPA: SDR family oxidoreductase [Chthoniobacteraceae bacterium]|nr:SDR family oxidoreductase [Chthoniobacteraceae bacterium]